MDVLFRGATVVDGSGAAGVQQDVAVRGERIVAVGPDATALGGAAVIDAGGLVLAPGFIDVHSHADHTLPANPRATNSITQGVTTELVGLCGFSVAPLAPDPSRAAQLRDLAQGIGPDLDWSWQSFGEFLDRFQAARPAVNVAPLVGHHALRISAMGMEDRPPTAAELASMRMGLAEALAQGAWGMSTGLVYVPGSFANTDELLEVGQELKQADALYVSHIRDEADGLVGAVDEAIAIGERLGIRTQVSHLKITARRNAGRIGPAIEHLEAARGRGVRAHADVYPYVAGSTYLHQVLPPWIKAGGLDAMVARLRVAEQRQRARHDIEHDESGWANHVAAAGGWHNIQIASIRSPARRAAEGRRIADLAMEAGEDPLDYTLDLLVEDRGATTMIVFHMDERDMRQALSWRWSAVGSDQLGVTGPSARVHPRAYGTFARVVGWGVREAALFPLEEAVRKMTGLAADILGLKDRGRVAPGLMADLVLFDPASVADEATYEEPTRPARGVEHVMLGGEFAVEHAKPVRLDLGTVLRRPAQG
ncbi:MAG TPA: D-aminoacylase [Chloroflexota bacterium]|nr:D-aminoacylase [Chloroflexota bacterium]